MPRFNEKERTEIYVALRKEGERLFSNLGTKKVTVSDLCKAVNISKGSYYLFYPNKENLYWDIINTLHQKMFRKMDAMIQNKGKNSSLELIPQIIKGYLQVTRKHPILDINNKQKEYLYLKDRDTDPNILLGLQINILMKLIDETGVQYKYPKEIIVRMLDIIVLSLSDKKLSEKEESILINIMTTVVY